MKEVKQNRKTRYTQMALRDSLIELMKVKAISQITIKELCENADINRTTFYTHYADQYRLLKSIEDETLTWIKEMIAEFSDMKEREAVVKNLEKAFEYIIQNKNHIQVLMSEQGSIDFQRDLLIVIYEQGGIWLVNSFLHESAKSELYFVFLVNGSI